MSQSCAYNKYLLDADFQHMSRNVKGVCTSVHVTYIRLYGHVYVRQILIQESRKWSCAFVIKGDFRAQK